MDYGGTIEAEQEVLIRLDRGDGQAHICSTWPAWSRRLERRYGSPQEITQRDGKITSACWTIPLNLVSLRRVTRPPRRLTEDQRQAARDHLLEAKRRRDTPVTSVG